MLGPRFRWSSGGQLPAGLQAGGFLASACGLPAPLSWCRTCVTGAGGVNKHPPMALWGRFC